MALLFPQENRCSYSYNDGVRSFEVITFTMVTQFLSRFYGDYTLYMLLADALIWDNLQRFGEEESL